MLPSSAQAPAQSSWAELALFSFLHSIASGTSSIASVTSSIASGSSSIASGTSSISSGSSSIASGTSSIASGTSSIASGTSSIAYGTPIRNSSVIAVKLPTVTSYPRLVHSRFIFICMGVMFHIL